MGALTFAGTLAVLFCLYSSSEGLDCLSCDQVQDINECVLNTAKCTGDTEYCYLDITVLPSLERVISAGCRAKQVCDLLSSASVGKRDISKRQSIACTQCCNAGPGANGFPCNGGLCNQKLDTINATCGVCERAKDPAACANSEQCPPNDMCKIDTVYAGGNLVHRLGCETKSVCDTILKAYKDTHSNAVVPTGAGKREGGDIIICSACCSSGRDCNKDKCTEVRKAQTCNNATICG